MLDLRTADMVWRYVTSGCYRLEVLHKELFERTDEKDIPAWSLTALLEVMKEYCPELLFLEAYWFCRCDRVESEYCDDPITAVYDVLCWLLEHRLIEKEEQDGQ